MIKSKSIGYVDMGDFAHTSLFKYADGSFGIAITHYHGGVDSGFDSIDLGHVSRDDAIDAYDAFIADYDGGLL